MATTIIDMDAAPDLSAEEVAARGRGATTNASAGRAASCRSTRTSAAASAAAKGRAAMTTTRRERDRTDFRGRQHWFRPDQE